MVLIRVPASLRRLMVRALSRGAALSRPSGECSALQPINILLITLLTRQVVNTAVVILKDAGQLRRCSRVASLLEFQILR